MAEHPPRHHSERPRERLLAYGPEPLSDVELLALILGAGGRAGSAVEVARRLLGRCGDLPELARAHPDELAATPGIGPARAAGIGAALELGRRLEVTAPARGRRLLCSADVFDLFHPRLRHRAEEVFLALALDARNRCRRELWLARGGSSACAVEPRDAFRALLAERAAATVFLHNHPSGDPTPSPQDRALTRRLVAAGDLLGVRVLDHVIVGDGRYASLADRGELVPGLGATRPAR